MSKPIMPIRAALLASAALFAAMPAWAQEVPAAAATPDEASVDPLARASSEAGEGEILVTGTRATQRSSIAFKRDADVVVDGLVSDEIGATPDNSVGDTLGETGQRGAREDQHIGLVLDDGALGEFDQHVFFLGADLGDRLEWRIEHANAGAALP